MADHEAYVILDARGLVLRSYNAGSDPEGALGPDNKTINSASYGFNRLFEAYPIFDSIPPRQIIAAWDGGNEHRKALWEGYKKKRHEKNKLAPEAKKVEQDKMVDYTSRLFSALGITQMRIPGVEADDVIAMLCEKLTTNLITIYTLDQDLLQLAGQHSNVSIVLCDTRIEGPHRFTGSDYDVPLHLITFYKSIVGDSSDEYPGVKGMGIVAFKRLLTNFGIDGLEQLKNIIRDDDYSQLRLIANSSQDKDLLGLADNYQHWKNMFQVASLAPEICEGVNNRKLINIEWTKRVPSYKALEEVLRDAGAIGRMAGLEQWVTRTYLADYSEQGGSVLAHFRDSVVLGPHVAFDYESYDTLKHEPFQLANKQNSGNYVDVMSQAITGVSFCYGDNLQYCIYLPCRHKETDDIADGKNYSPKDIAWAVNHAETKSRMIAHNAPFENTLTLNDLQLPLKHTIHDTRLMAAYVDEDDSLGLKSLSKKFLDYTQTSYKDTLDKYDAADMSEMTAKQTVTYGCDDSIVTAHLADLFWMITTIEGTWNFLSTKEFEFIHEQVRGYMAGVNFDMDRIRELDVEATQEYEEGFADLTKALSENCKEPNINAATALYNDLLALEKAKNDKGIIDGEKLDRWIQTNWERIYMGSQYVPFQRMTEKVEVKPTPSVLRDAAAKIGFTKVMEKATKKFLTEEWIPEASSDPVVSQGGQEFIDKVVAVINAKAWKRPEDQSYIDLAFLCHSLLTPDDKVTTIGDELNFDSPNQMQCLLYGKMGLPIRMRSKVQRNSMRDKCGMSGSPATDNGAIDMALAEDVKKGDWRYDALMSFRKAKTAMTAKKLFYRPLPMWEHPLDGMVHPSIMDCGTVTRRPSGSSPNMLFLTKKDGGKLRSSVKPYNDEHVIVTADWSGQELRIMASESGDPVMIDAYIGENKKDVHSITASAISPAFFRLPQFIEEYGIEPYYNLAELGYDDFVIRLKEEQDHHPTRLAKSMAAIRKAAKGVNFLIAYMGGYTTLAQRLLIQVMLAKELMNQTFSRFSRIQPWQREVIEFARTYGYTLTAYGNRRHLGDGLFSSDDGIRSRLERQGVNAVIQGTAADILKVTMAEVTSRKLSVNTGSYLIAPVYDELASSVPRAGVVDYCFELQDIMSITPPNHVVPMVAEFSVSSSSWGEVIELGADITEDKINRALDVGQEQA